MLNRRALFQFAGVAAVAGVGAAAWMVYGSRGSQGLAGGPFRHYPFDPVASANFQQKLFVPVASGPFGVLDVVGPLKLRATAASFTLLPGCESPFLLYQTEHAGQRILVETEAEAFAVERVDRRPTVRREQGSVHGLLRATMLRERAIGADRSHNGSSRSHRRLFGGRRGGDPDAGRAFLCTPAHSRAVRDARTLPWRSCSSQVLALTSTARKRMPCRPGSTIEMQHHRTN